MAQLYRDKLEDQLRAVELFNEALDLNPGYLEAFERINKILTAQKDWKQLERAFRKMLHRVAGKGNTELEFNLWHALGLIYRDRLSEVEHALEAFKMASALKPENMTEHLILSELYESSDQIDLAIGEFQAILKLDPMRVDPYRKLYGLYLTKNAYDEAWCLAPRSTSSTRRTTRRSASSRTTGPQGMPQVKSRLDGDAWIRRTCSTRTRTRFSARSSRSSRPRRCARRWPS
jgi:golgin subfamily B member 1